MGEKKYKVTVHSRDPPENVELSSAALKLCAQTSSGIGIQADYTNESEEEYYLSITEKEAQKLYGETLHSLNKAINFLVKNSIIQDYGGYPNTPELSSMPIHCKELQDLETKHELYSKLFPKSSLIKKSLEDNEKRNLVWKKSQHYKRYEEAKTADEKWKIMNEFSKLHPELNISPGAKPQNHISKSITRYNFITLAVLAIIFVGAIIYVLLTS